MQQAADKLQAICPDVPVGVYSAGLGSRDTDEPVIVAGIQSVYQKADVLGHFDLVLIDECHLLPEEGEGMYRTFLQRMKEINPNVRLIGLTATPYRLKSGMLCGPDNLLNEICYEIGVKELIVRGYLCPLKSKGSELAVDTSDLHLRGGEFVPAEVEAFMGADEFEKAACKEIVSRTKDRNSVLVFAASVERAEAVQKLLAVYSDAECAVVTGETSSNERDLLLRRFKGERIEANLLGDKLPPLKYLVNVNVLTTGFDAPNVDCVVLLRPTASPGLFYQMCLDMETEVLTPSGWRHCHEIAVGDQVGAFDLQSEEIVYVTAENKVHRSLRRGEAMYGIMSPRLDIRVTNNHNMIVRAKGPTCRRWQVQTAEHVSRRSDGYKIPVAGKGETHTHEAGLTDAEIAFLGWFLTDGYRNHCNGAVIINQSAKKFPDEIRRVLTDCGFGFREYRQKRRNKLERFEDNVSFVIPYGDPRGSQAGKKGWSHLEPWIDKDVPGIYNSLSKRQFSVLVQAMDKGNGCNREPLGLDYTPRTTTIALGCRRRLADRIQQLAVERGFRCDVRHYRPKPNEWNLAPQEQWKIALRETRTVFVGGTRKDENEMIPRRSHFGPVSHTRNEWVWCLTTARGTLVTRRNGKVAIVGNCGRGFRLHESKSDCLVLDYGNNILRHGPVDMVRIKPPSERDGPGAAPAKECPKCHLIMHAAISVCSECGFEFPKREVKHERQASGEGIVSGETTDTTYSVYDIDYSVHTKWGATDDSRKTVRVDYVIQQGRSFRVCKSEWVCPEHDGWARKKFEDWWTKRSDTPPPFTAQEVVEIAESGALIPSLEIVVRKVAGEKYDRIVKYRLADGPPLPPEFTAAPDATSDRFCGDCSYNNYGYCDRRQKQGVKQTDYACDDYLEVDDEVPF